MRVDEFSPAEIDRLSHLGAKMVIGTALDRAQQRNHNINLLFADVGSRFNLLGFIRSGGRCYETGITEQNMIGVAAGMAHEGENVFALTYAPFAMGRVFDQVKANLGEMQLPVKIIGAASGFAASDLGPLLTCHDDIALSRVIPGVNVIAPADCLEVVKAICAIAEVNSPAYIRITGGKYVEPVYRTDYKFEIGKSVTLHEGSDILIIGCGTVLASVLIAANALEKDGYSCKVINMHTIKPLDVRAIGHASAYKLVVTVEEHSIVGGLGSAVAEYFADNGVAVPFLRIGVPDKYLVADTPENSLAMSGLDAASIVRKITAILDR